MTYKVAYAGMDKATWFLLLQEPSFDLAAAAYIPKLANQPTYNPCNYVWKKLYGRYMTQGRLTPLQQALLWSLRPFLTAAWRAYHRFFLSIQETRARLIDFDDTDQTVQFMHDQAIDLLVVNVWGLLPSAIINAPTYKTVNIHPSKLPQYRGAVPTLIALKNKDIESAVSYIVLDASVDGGDLVAQHTFSITAADNYLSIERKVTEITGETLLTDLQSYLKGANLPKLQDPKLSSTTPTYYSYMKIDGQTETAMDIYNKVNLYPYLEVFDYCYGFVGQRKLSFKGINISSSKLPLSAGDYAVRGIYVYFMASDGMLRSRLGRGLSWKDSLYVLAHTKGIIRSSKEKNQ